MQKSGTDLAMSVATRVKIFIIQYIVYDKTAQNVIQYLHRVLVSPSELWHLTGGKILISRFCPNLYFESLYQIDLSHLKSIGIRGIVFDIDNTVTMWGSDKVPQDTLKWLEDTKTQGFRVCLLSNNRKARVDSISCMLDIPSAKGFKPFGSAFRSALSLLGTSPKETAIIGDQIFTDILGGNRAGLYTILVQPLSTTEFFTTRLFRKLERIVLHKLACRGMLKP